MSAGPGAEVPSPLGAHCPREVQTRAAAEVRRSERRAVGESGYPQIKMAGPQEGASLGTPHGGDTGQAEAASGGDTLQAEEPLCRRWGGARHSEPETAGTTGWWKRQPALPRALDILARAAGAMKILS